MRPRGHLAIWDITAGTPGPLGLHVFVDDFVEKASNLVRGASPTGGSAPYKPSPWPDLEAFLCPPTRIGQERSFPTSTSQKGANITVRACKPIDVSVVTFDSQSDFESTRARFDERVPLFDLGVTATRVISQPAWSEVQAGITPTLGPSGLFPSPDPTKGRSRH